MAGIGGLQLKAPDETRMRVHAESWQSRDLAWLAVLNAFQTLSCSIFGTLDHQTFILLIYRGSFSHRHADISTIFFGLHQVIQTDQNQLIL
jgi:hypothetical protein